MEIVTRIENWKWRKFGYCPACGAIGMEVFPSMDSERIDFQCTRFCKTNAPADTYRIAMGMNATPNLRHISCTQWMERKPKWWRKQRAEGYFYSWNWERFGAYFCERNGLV